MFARSHMSSFQINPSLHCFTSGVTLQEHATHVADVQQRIFDVASDETTQERVQKALLKELEHLKIVENIQALSGDLKTSGTKMEDRIEHQGQHLERFFTDQLANAKSENDRNLNFQIKEVLSCHVAPLAKSREIQLEMWLHWRKVGKLF